MEFWRQRLSLFWSDAFWLIPLAGLVVGWLLEGVAAELDQLAGDLVTGTYSTSAAETLLSAVGGGMITFTGFVFSVVLLMLQFGTATYSPRTVSYFLRDRTAQTALAIFLGTIAFCFQTLITVGSEGRADFVPLVSVLLALAALGASLLAFLALIQVVGRTLRVDSLLTSIGRTARDRLSRYEVTSRVDHGRRSGGDHHLDAEVVRHVGPPGQLVAVAAARLGRLAVTHDLQIELLVGVGDGISTGTPIARAQGTGVDPRAIRRGLLVRDERSLNHDPLYALRLLVDVGLRALSAAINDPTTAVRALDEIEGVLRTGSFLAASSDLETSGERLRLRTLTWSDLVDLALLEILEAGIDAPQITRRLTALITDLLADVPADHQPALLRWRRRLVDEVSARVPPEYRGTWLAADRQGLGG